MTIEALRGRAASNLRRRASSDRRGPAPPAISAVAIGDDDIQVFDCPGCRRPLVEGTRHCPGCGARLLLGVRARLASAFVAAGLVAGIAIGATGTLALAVGERGSPGPVAAIAPTARPSLAAAPAASPRATPGAPSAVPGEVAVTLGQTVTINGRLAAWLPTLRTELAAPSLDSLAVAATLRAIAVDASIGSDLAGRVGAWPPGAALADELGAFYAGIRTTAADGLASSLENLEAYRIAAAAMVAAIQRVASVDAATRELAAAAAIDLPALGAINSPAP